LKGQNHEIELQELIRHYPNFIHPELREMPVSKTLGAINVCLKEAELPKCNGRIDLAFVTDTTVYLVELKAKEINQKTLEQYRQYLPEIQENYPNHHVEGFLVGRTCPDRSNLEKMIGDENIKILLFGRDLPGKREIRWCRHCRAGFSVHEEVCLYCGEPF